MGINFIVSFGLMLYNIYMIFSSKKTRKVLITAFVLISVIFSANTARAQFLTTITIKDGLDTFFTFIVKNFINPVKEDFCRQYILSLSDGSWAPSEYRTTLGQKICTSFKVPKNTSEKIKTDTIQSLNGNAKVSTTENPSTSSVNNPQPDVYVPTSTPTGNDLNINQIFDLTNSDRKVTDSSLVTLKYNSTLQKIAEIRVQDMFDKQYFEHNSPTGDNASKEAAKNGYSYITIGENIALGNFGGSRGLETAWMNSPGHRANILNKNYTELGVAAISGMYNGNKVWIAAQIFGKPLTGCTAPDADTKEKIVKYKASADIILKNIQNIDIALKTISQNDTDTYNAKVAERNTSAKLYNNLATEIKTLVADYNSQAATYNACIKTI